MTFRLLAAATLLALSGCLPSSQRQIDRSMLASDSASVALAAFAPVDTLTRVWTVEPPLALATGLTWLRPHSPDAQLAVVETQTSGVHFWTSAGQSVGAWALAEDAFPYLAGTDGDTVAVLARGRARVDWLANGRVVQSVPAPDGATTAFVRDSLLLVRVGGGPEGGPPALVRLDPRGRVVSRHPISGAPWRAVGYLRPWGGNVLALSGYRPVADVWTPAAASGAALDTLALRGFASPVLARSAEFMRGDAEQPPLLAASAAALGDRLFVLNLRDDQLRIDVYRRDGQIERVLVGPEPMGTRPVVDIDLAVRERAGVVEVAILSTRPGGLGRTPAARLALYRWRPAE